MAKHASPLDEAMAYHGQRWQQFMRRQAPRRLLIQAGTLAALGGATAVQAIMAACTGGAREAEYLGRREEGSFQYSRFPLVDKYNWRRMPMGDVPYYGGRLVDPAGGPRSWDFVRGDPGSAYGGMVGHTLMALDEGLDMDYDELRLVNYAAKRVSHSPDYMVWTIELDRNLRFHPIAPVNGRPVTADDVVQCMRLYATKSVYSGQLEMVDKFTVIDKLTLRIDLKLPILFMPAVLATPNFWIFPPEYYENNYEQFRLTPIASGPFYPTKLEPPNHYEFNGFKDFNIVDKQGYRQPYLGAYWGYSFADDNARKAALRSKQIDMWNVPNMDHFEDIIGTTPDLIVQVTAIDPAKPVGILLQHKEPLFQDVRIRRALSMAVDRQKIMDVLYRGAAVPGLVMPYAALGKSDPLSLEECGPYWRYNPAEAKRLLAEAGYPNGFEVKYDISTSASAREVQELLRAQWSDIGVKLTYNDLESQVVTGRRNDKTFEHMTAYAGLNGYDVDALLYNLFMPNRPQNYGSVNDPVLTTLLERQRNSLDADERERLFKQIHERLQDQVYTIMLVSPNRIVVRHPWVLRLMNHLWGNFFGWYNAQVRGTFATDQAPEERRGRRAGPPPAGLS